MEPEKELTSFLSNSATSFEHNAEENLYLFLSLIKQWSKKMNLISYADRRDIFKRHFIPSFWFYDVIKQDKPEYLLDLGTGAGFPGMILKILYPKTEVILIESNRKKTLFLKEVADQLDINPIIINDRIENINAHYKKTFDVIVSRAVTSINRIWQWSHGLLNSGGAVFVLKGADYKSESDYKEKNDIKIEEIKPEPKWTSGSPNLTNKLILKMRKQ